MIGVILPTVNSRTSAKLLKGIIDEASLRGYDVSIASCEHNEEKELALLQSFRNVRVRGVIALTTNADLYVNRKKKFSEVVVITQQKIEMRSIVYPDQVAIEEIFDELVLPFPDKITRICTVTSDSLHERRNKIAKIVKDKKIRIPHYEFKTENIAEYPIDIQLEKGTFYLCVTDQIAINLYSSAKKQGLVIGEDIFICGFGDYSISKLVTPALTSVNFPYYESGVRAVNTLLTENAESKSSYMDYTLKKRDSTL